MPASSSGFTAVCVLVAVDTYEHPGPFPSIGGDKARQGVERLGAVLRGRAGAEGAAGAVSVIPLVNPWHPRDVMEVLHKLEGSPPDLLVFFYMGHGYRDGTARYEPEKLYLTTRASSARSIEHTAVAFRDLANGLKAIRAARTVVVLDCCYSGNFPRDVLPEDRHFTVLASSRRGSLISPGEPEDPLTPFTAHLVQALGEGPCSLAELGRRLTEMSEAEENRPRTPYLPWHPVELSTADGASTVLPPGTVSSPSPPPQSSPPPSPPPPWGQAVRRRLGGHRRPVVLGVLTLLAAVGAGAYVMADGASPVCPPPLELRMAAAPEAVGPMRELARGFEDSAANHRARAGAHDCRSARFTVYGVSLDALTEAFGSSGHWGDGRGELLAEVGPQPDVWVSQSSAEVSPVRLGLVPPAGVPRQDFLTYSTVMRDVPVLVLTDTARRRLGLPDSGGRVGRTDWRRLREALHEAEDGERPALLRPNPAVSGVGLAHTLGMYDADGEGAFEGEEMLPEAEIDWLETEVISQGRSVAGSAQALCALDAADATGALVGHREADLFAQNPADYCPGSAESVVHRYRLGGGPPLDHQLVEVAWPADDRGERAEALGRFGRWAKGEEGREGLEALGEAGYEKPDGYLPPLSDGDVGDRLDLFRQAHPELRLSVLFDVTGSMRENGRLPAAKRAVEESLNRLGKADRYRVTVFPAARDGSGSRSLVKEWSSVPEAGAGLELDEDVLRPERDRQADLLAALRDLAGRIPESEEQQHAILLVTDGDHLEGRAPRVEELGKLAERLGDLRVPVIVASMRPYGCAVAKDTGTVARRSGGECESLSGDLATALSRQVAALSEGRRQ